MTQSNQKPTVRAGRRRPTTGSSTTQRQRAEAPSRDAGGTPGATPPLRPSSGGVPGFPGSRGGRPTLLGLVMMVIIACVFIAYMIWGGGDLEDIPLSSESGGNFTEDTTSVPQEQVADEGLMAPTRTIRPTSTPQHQAANSTSEASWTIILYQDADDKILEQDIYLDLNEAERSGSTDRVHIVAQVDRFQGAYQGDGNWTSARRFYITQDDDLSRVYSQVLADLGEVNMANPETLVDFVTWAIETYPAEHYALILSDHGMGWPGGWSDPAPGGRGDPSIPLSAALGNHLYLHELDEALGEILTKSGLDKLDIIGMDACLMGHFEVFAALAPHAHYAIASQEVEPALGWAYTGFLDKLVLDPSMGAEELSRIIVESYIDEDQRVIDDQARSEMLRQGSVGGVFGLFGQPTAKQVAAQLGENSTLTAVRLAKLPELIERFNAFSYLLQDDNQSMVAKARTYAQSFTSIFGNQVPPSYIDLGSFIAIIKRETGNRDVSAAIDVLMISLNETILAEKHGVKKPGATGISIYFPNSKLFQNANTGPQSYQAIAARFSKDTLWDDFLIYHYTKRVFDPQPVEPSRTQPGVAVRGPGEGIIAISEIEFSSGSVAPGDSVLVSADVGGGNIGQIYLFVGFYDGNANAIFLADMDYLESEPTREVNGVFYPTWSEADEFRLEFEWEPVVFNITDGNNSYTALLKPQSYGATPGEAVYSVEGVYRFANNSGEVNARLLFSDGVLRQVVGITGVEDTGAPREIIPQSGDQFTILEKWFDLDSAGKVRQQAQQEGGILEFGVLPFTWEELDAAAGEYIVGFIVEDMDGNSVQSYDTVQVR
jgi:hypothetical protein